MSIKSIDKAFEKLLSVFIKLTTRKEYVMAKAKAKKAVAKKSPVKKAKTKKKSK